MGSDNRDAPGDHIDNLTGIGKRSDTTILLHLSGDRQHAYGISIPRDSWVDIPGQGTSKINASLVYGGPALLIQTVESISGLKIDYYALTTFWGLSQLYDNLGGLTIDVPFAMQDSYSKWSTENIPTTVNCRSRGRIPAGVT